VAGGDGRAVSCRSLKRFAADMSHADNTCPTLFPAITSRRSLARVVIRLFAQLADLDGSACAIALALHDRAAHAGGVSPIPVNVG